MLLNALVLVAIDRLLPPRFANCGVPDMKEISQLLGAPIVIAGFCRYGQIVTRLLQAEGYTCTVLDQNAAW